MLVRNRNFKVGDRVRWASQARGRQTVKRGRIVAVVPPGVHPFIFDSWTWKVIDLNPALNLNASEYSLSSLGGGMAREQESYLVLVDRGNGKKPALYWPRASTLRIDDK